MQLRIKSLMAMGSKLPLHRYLSIFFLLFLLFASATILALEDPELKQCKHQCKHQQRFTETEKEECRQECQDYYREKQRIESQKGGGGVEDTINPYVFEDRHFTTTFKSQLGRVRLLPKFTQRSNLLSGIKNYRVSILEAHPRTFLMPTHFDAHTLFFVARGKGSISLMSSKGRESFKIVKGDVFKVPAGTTTYLINPDNNERLVLTKLVCPVSTPGHFQSFFGGGGEDPESFYKAFSTEILEAAFKTRRDKLQRIFGEQRQGGIIKASEDQIRELMHYEKGTTRIWPFGKKVRESDRPLNLLNKRPTYSNDYGRLHQIDANDFRALRDLDVSVSFANVTKGSMEGPLYNSKVTKIAMVVEGEGYFEMACPHLSRFASTSYKKVRAHLRPGFVFIIPAGHPVVTIASSNQNLHVICFEVNAKNNEKFLLAGKRNVMSRLKSAAKELAFGVDAREVEELFTNQEEELFFKAPQHKEEDTNYV